MKILILLTFFYWGGAAFCGEQEYLVKIKNRQVFEVLKGDGAQKVFETSFGLFSVIKSEKSTAYLNRLDGVLYAEKNSTFQAQPILRVKNSPKDNMFEDQWGLKNTGRNSGSVWSRGRKGEDVNIEKAWSHSVGSREIKIAVIDSGVDYRHEDLKDNIFINELELNGQTGVDDDGNGYVDDIHGYDFANDDADPMDGFGHGTHCAGIIAAKHNDLGVRGVMDKVKIIPIKFLADTGVGTLEAAIKSIDYAIKMKADIMNNSWSGGEVSTALKEAIEAANSEGILFVAAAGNAFSNNDKYPIYPLAYNIENIISVGSFNPAGKKSYFSNYGKKTVHVFAPGTNILSTTPGNSYEYMSGTSMAAPFVSGAVGLLLSREKNLSIRDIKERLIESAAKTKKLSNYTISGRLDAYGLLSGKRN